MGSEYASTPWEQTDLDEHSMTGGINELGAKRRGRTNNFQDQETEALQGDKRGYWWGFNDGAFEDELGNTTGVEPPCSNREVDQPNRG